MHRPHKARIAGSSPAITTSNNAERGRANMRPHNGREDAGENPVVRTNKKGIMYDLGWLDKIVFSLVAITVAGLIGLMVHMIVNPDPRPIECINGYSYRIGDHGEMYIRTTKYGPVTCK